MGVCIDLIFHPAVKEALAPALNLQFGNKLTDLDRARKREREQKGVRCEPGPPAPSKVTLHNKSLA